MEILALDVRLDGYADPVGVLVRDNKGAVAFAYKAEYLSDPDSTPLSLSLPLTTDPYEDVVTRPFFDNLLQERDGALADIMARESLARDDIAGLLFHIGKDCAGALSVLPAGAPPTKVPGVYDQDYVPIPPDRLKAIVESLHKRRRLPEGTEDPSPLAGVQSKIALTLLPDGTLAEPNPGSGAPTTHILKVPDQDHLQDALLEAEAMHVSQALGFETAEAVVTPIADINALLVTRFDRGLDKQNRIVRIHQEDFAQALGLPASFKYERRGVEGRRFDVSGIRRILEATGDPAGEKDTFIRATLFDLLIGNADGHAKNFALLFEQGGRIRMAPRYDILPTRLDDRLTDELAYKIGSARTLNEVTIANFEGFLQAMGIDSAAARRRIRLRHTNEIASRLATHLAELNKGGMKRFADLIASNTRILLGALAVDVPDAA
ncbi:phosphatidylinositol kinase [Mesorhizobium tianshanense]|uniref:Serine/threonine-protein kinase HipA n=1 Tax=Mesorhizobium tianshanense TaxID=39844 RepID=A0A562PBY1_9HYPH|nr:HipA domain-containing protein [Mesorhizobium tianshanense]TWI41934.1 serine/threonine-protein kinase HipA [Mesorhizobium tianshanense]GLS34741.1 phosphatidylinositol kinase [Mesorhizobium tianshanense]